MVPYPRGTHRIWNADAYPSDGDYRSASGLGSSPNFSSCYSLWSQSWLLTGDGSLVRSNRSSASSYFLLLNNITAQCPSIRLLSLLSSAETAHNKTLINSQVEENPTNPAAVNVRRAFFLLLEIATQLRWIPLSPFKHTQQVEAGHCFLPIHLQTWTQSLYPLILKFSSIDFSF